MSYAGDISCLECWEALQKDDKAILIDVRTNAEWAFVGMPNLDASGKKTVLIDWQQYPHMAVNPSFVDQVNNHVAACGSDKNSKIFLLCRSGVRSIAAAEALTADGYQQAFNVLGGFEGNPDEKGHRGNKQGWKADGLPWIQK